MAVYRRPHVRRIETHAGDRYLVQVPHDQERVAGWRRYELLVTGPGSRDSVRLTLFERTGGEAGDGPRAA